MTMTLQELGLTKSTHPKDTTIRNFFHSFLKNQIHYLKQIILLIKISNIIIFFVIFSLSYCPTVIWMIQELLGSKHEYQK